MQRLLALTSLLFFAPLLASAQTPRAACRLLMDDVCGEHCGLTKNYQLGEWSMAGTLAAVPVRSTDSNHLVTIYRSQQNGEIPAEAKLVTVDLEKRRLSADDLPVSMATDGLSSALSGTRYVAIESKNPGFPKELHVFDRETGEVTTVPSPTAIETITPFVWKSTATEISYFSFATGRIETLDVGKPIQHAGFLKDNIFLSFADGEELVYNVKKLRDEQEYTPLKIEGLAGDRKLLAADGASKYYVIEQVMEQPVPPEPPAAPAPPAPAKPKGLFRGLWTRVFGAEQNPPSVTQTPPSPPPPTPARFVSLYREGVSEPLLKDFLVQANQNVAAGFSESGLILELHVSAPDGNPWTTKLFDLRTGRLELRLDKTFARKPAFFKISEDDLHAIAVYTPADSSSPYVMASYDLANGETREFRSTDLPSGISWYSSSNFHLIKNSRSVYIDGAAVIADFHDGSYMKLPSFIAGPSDTSKRYDPQSNTLSKTFPLGNETQVLRVLSLERTNAQGSRPAGLTADEAMREFRAVLQGYKPVGEKVFQHLNSYFATGAYKSNAALTSEAVLWMGARSPLALSKYLSAYSDIPTVIGDGRIDLTNQAQQNRIAGMATRFIDNFVSGDYNMRFSLLPVLKTYFEVGPNRDLMRDQIVRIAELYVDSLGVETGFESVDPSVRLALLIQATRRATGQKSRAYSDITMNPGNGVVVAYGTGPVDGQNVDAFGLSARVLGAVTLDTQVNQTFTWHFDDLEQRATIVSTPLPTVDLTPPAQAAPNYAQLRPNGKLTGVIGISANMGEGFARDLGAQYKEYYEEQGFSFQTLRFQQGSEALEFLEARIRSGEVGYFIREGHGENRGEYAVSVSPNMEIEKGVNPETNEVIYILEPGLRNTNLPAYNPGLTFSRLGAALRGRPRPEDEFLYVESKCMGLSSVGSHMTRVGAKGFVAVGTNQYATTFTNEDASAIHLLIEGLRGSKNYSEMASTTVDAPYYFPDSQTYFAAIGNLHRVTPSVVEIHRNLGAPGAAAPAQGIDP